MRDVVLFLQLPSPPFLDVERESAGGFGLAVPSVRDSYGHSRYPFFNLSLAQTMGVLEKKGWDVSFIDAQAERWGLKETLIKILEIQPKYIIALINLPSLWGDLNFLKEVKSFCPNTKIICMGSVCKVLPQIVTQDSIVDFTIISEPETTITDLLNSVKRRKGLSKIKGIAFRAKGKLHFTPSREILMDIDSLPVIPYHLLPMDKYKGAIFASEKRKNENFAPLSSTKGCPFKCSYYCPYPLGFGNKVRYRSPTKVVEEIEYLHKEFNIRNFVFRDQNFTLFPSHTQEICNLLSNKGLDIKWICETRFDLINNALLLEKMREAGCQEIHFGLESGDVLLFEKVGKPGTKFRQIQYALEMVKATGINTLVHIIIGLPGETWQTVRNTAKTLKILKVGAFNFTYAVPYPGTVFYGEAKGKRLILTNDWSRYDGSHVVVRSEKMSPLELKLAKVYLENTVAGFHFHLRLLWKVVRGLKKFFTFRRLTQEKFQKEINNNCSLIR